MADTDAHKTAKPIVVDNKMLCKACNKRVYELEKLVMGDVTYHKTCFRCQNCNCVLRLNNFAALNGKNYCKPHFIEAFKLKGNYVSGFADDEDEKAKARKGDGATNQPTTESGQSATSKPVVAQSKPVTTTNGQTGDRVLHKPVIAKSISVPLRTEEGGAALSVTASGDLPSQGITRQRLAQLNKQMSEEQADGSAASRAPQTVEKTNVTRNMMKKFESMNTSDKQAPSSHQEEMIGRRPSHDMPVSDTTRNMLAKFRSMEEQSRASTKAEEPVKEGGSQAVSRETSSDAVTPEDIVNDPDSGADAEDDYLQLRASDDEMEMNKVRAVQAAAAAKERRNEQAAYSDHEVEDNKGHNDNDSEPEDHEDHSDKHQHLNDRNDEDQVHKDHDEDQDHKDHDEDQDHKDHDEDQDHKDHSDEHHGPGDHIDEDIGHRDHHSGEHKSHGDHHGGEHGGSGDHHSADQGHRDASSERQGYGDHSGEPEGHGDHSSDKHEGHGDLKDHSTRGHSDEGEEGHGEVVGVKDD